MFGAGVGLFFAVVLAGAFGLVLIVFAAFRFVVLIVVKLVGVFAQLVAIAQIGDHLARELGKGLLIAQKIVNVIKRFAGLLFDEPAPQVHHVLRAFGQVAARGKVADQIARGRGQRRVLGRGDLRIALARGFLPDLGVDVAGGAGHVARAHRLAPRGLHRLIEIAGHVAGRGIAGMGAFIVVLAVHRQRIGGAARHQHFFAGHPAGDLRQAHLIARKPCGINAVADRQFGVVGHHAGRFGQRFLERIGRVVVLRFRHGRAPSGSAGRAGGAPHRQVSPG